MCLILVSANTFHLRSAFMESVSCDRYRKKVLNLNQEQTIKGADCTWLNGDSHGGHAHRDGKGIQVENNEWEWLVFSYVLQKLC